MPVEYTTRSTALATPARQRLLQGTKLVPRSFKRTAGIKGGVYYVVQTMPEFEAFYAEAVQQPTLCIDTETSGLDWVRSDVCGIVVSWGVENNFYLPVDHKTTEKQLKLSVIRPFLQKLFTDRKKTYVFHHAKYDMHMLKRAGISVRGVVHDVLILSYLVDENMSHKLKDMAVKLIHKNADKWEDGIDKWRLDEAKRRRSAFSALLKEQVVAWKEDPDRVAEATKRADIVRAEGRRSSVNIQLRKMAAEHMADHPLAKNKKKDISYDYIPVAEIYPYACADTHYTWLLYKRFIADVGTDSALCSLYVTESKLLKVLFEVEQKGVKIDVPYLRRVSPELGKEIAEKAKAIHADVGYEFNIDSDDELVSAFNKAGVRLTKPTKGSAEKIKNGAPLDAIKYSVDKDVLEGLAAQYAFARGVLDYRAFCKLKRTYADGILSLVDANDYLHSNINQNVRTGRMSSSNPNIQNIPGRDMTIRRAFLNPDDDHLFVFIDYSQVELRLTAHYSQDETLLACYPFDGEGTDVHSLTCAEVVMERPYDEVVQMKDDFTGCVQKVAAICGCPGCLVKFFRNIAKRVNFGIIYGAGPKAIQRQVSTPERPVSVADCDLYIKKYLAKYRGVKLWIDMTHRFMKKHGWVQNAFGRYRRFPDFSKRNTAKWQRERMSRQGVNFLIQGSAADLFKTAAVRVQKLLKADLSKTRLVNFVHDELQFYWRRDEFHLLKSVKSEMEDFNFSVPIVADIAYSTTNWASKKELKAA